MQTITISSQAKTVHNLLRQARHDGVILQSPEGERFIPTPIGDWVGFNVGESDDFAEEVERTGANQELMDVLSRRKSRNAGRYLSAEEVRRHLELDPRA